MLPPATWSVLLHSVHLVGWVGQDRKGAVAGLETGSPLGLLCHVGAKATPTHPFAPYSHSNFLPFTPCAGDITTPIFWHKRRLQRYRISTFGRDAKDMHEAWQEKRGARVKGAARRRNLELLTERMREILKHKFNAHIPLILNAYPNLFRSITFRYVFLTPF